MNRLTIRILSIAIAIAAAGSLAIREHLTTRQLIWEPYSSDRLHELLAQRKTVLVSVCGLGDLSGIVHECVAIGNPAMYRFVRESNAVPLRADFTDDDPEVRQLMDSLVLDSIAFAVYSPNDPDVPVVLRDIVAEGQLRQVIAHARDRTGRTKP